MYNLYVTLLRAHIRQRIYTREHFAFQQFQTSATSSADMAYLAKNIFHMRNWIGC